ncbi:hypothetical protein [Novosphingobium sp.]|uniref:hypothetical protein n=1 Tax=Novosphingobium sp. TaxID=1874826 RepID=UPI003341271A
MSRAQRGLVSSWGRTKPAHVVNGLPPVVDPVVAAPWPSIEARLQRRAGHAIPDFSERPGG